MRTREAPPSSAPTAVVNSTQHSTGLDLVHLHEFKIKEEEEEQKERQQVM